MWTWIDERICKRCALISSNTSITLWWPHVIFRALTDDNEHVNVWFPSSTAERASQTPSIVQISLVKSSQLANKPRRCLLGTCSLQESQIKWIRLCRKACVPLKKTTLFFFSKSLIPHWMDFQDTLFNDCVFHIFVTPYRDLNSNLCWNMWNIFTSYSPCVFCSEV